MGMRVLEAAFTIGLLGLVLSHASQFAGLVTGLAHIYSKTLGGLEAL